MIHLDHAQCEGIQSLELESTELFGRQNQQINLDKFSG